MPDLRGRVPVGVDGAAGRLDALDTLGSAGGAQKHTLTEPEIPAHSHAVAVVQEVNIAGSAGGGEFVIGASPEFGTIGTETAGGGGAHNNMPPYQVVTWIVKA